MALPFNALCLLLFPSSASAFLAFKPNCTLPPEVVQYVSNPQVRGTLQIVWSCLTVLGLCTWSIQHPSVPIKNDELKPPSRQRRFGLAAFTAFAKVFCLKKKPILWNEFFDEVRWNFDRVKWMGAVLLFPEFYFAKALTENCAANDSRKQIEGDEWTTMHGFFANMRGLVMVFESTAVKRSMEPSAPTALGRELSKPCPHGVPTVYYAQDFQRAAAIEFEHCQEVCGRSCPSRIERGAAAAPWQKIQRIKDAEGEMIKRSWSDGSLDLHSPVKQRTFLAAINTTMFPFATNTLSSSVPMSATTLVNSPASARRRGRDNSLLSPLTMSTTLQNNVVPEAKGDDLEGPPSANDPVSRHPLSLDVEVQPIETSYLLPHPPWTGSWPLSALQIQRAHALGLLPAPPYISSQDLRNQSKSDVLVKLLTVWQILWLTITILVRASQNLSITLIEITVLAFAATALATYILLWHKPQDVKVPHTIPALRRLTREDVIKLAALSPLSTMKVYEFFLHGVAVRAMGDGVFPFTRGLRASSFTRVWKPWLWFRARRPRQAEGKGDEPPELYMNPVPLGIGVGGAIFGAVHMTAADFFFPTPVERLLWRISCGILIGLPVVGVGIYSGYMHYTKEWQGKRRDDSKVSIVLLRFGEALIPIYLLARTYLFVETLRSLAYCEVSAFQDVQWPSAIPHYI